MNRSINLPAKVVVSLRAGVVLAAANIVCVLILAWAYTSAKAQPKVISVTGSAKKVIQSDLIVWEARISVNDPDLHSAYERLTTTMQKTVAFLKSRGIAESEVQVSPIVTSKNPVRDANGRETDKVSSYDLVQTVQVTSSDVQRVADTARRSTELIRDGVMLESTPPRYLYTRLADLKVTMLAEATKDAAARAEQIASNSGAELGAIQDARMGVMQINPIHSNTVSDRGNSDTSSFEKEIMAVVSARFALN